MDLGTIKKKLGHNLYDSPSEFIEDVNLVYDNCILFNKAESAFGMIAQRMKFEFQNLMSSINFEKFFTENFNAHEFIINSVREYKKNNSLGQIINNHE